MKYIFVVGAPGSKWSSTVKNIYYSADIDQSDYTEERTYWHDAPGTFELMHLGVYWDPGMEFGSFFDNLKDYTKEECETEFNRPFTGKGIRIIKSHVFCDQIDLIRERWPDSPIVTVHRGNDACLGWWVRCGHFGITYPDYDQYYQNLYHMGKIINQQNANLLAWRLSNKGTAVNNNHELCSILGISVPPAEYDQNYTTSDISVMVH
jgi:hypothetical protein